MIITDGKKLIEVQKEFNQIFPYLKIEFYAGPHEPGQGSPVRERLNSGQSIGQVRRTHTEGDLRIDSEMSVGAFEQHFLKKYGLNVQVFRKSGNLWIQTTSTDNWSLAQQNRKGGSSEMHAREKYETEELINRKTEKPKN